MYFDLHWNEITPWKSEFALNPKLSIPISALVIGFEIYSDPESKVQPIFTSLVCNVWYCEMVVNGAWLVFGAIVVSICFSVSQCSDFQ